MAMPEEPIETGTGLQEAYLVEILLIGGLMVPVFTYLGGIRREFPIGGEITMTARAGAIHLLGLVHGHWNLASEERVDTVRDSPDGGERVNMGIAIVMPIARLLEILDYPDVRARGEGERVGNCPLKDIPVDTNRQGTTELAVGVTCASPIRYEEIT